MDQVHFLNIQYIFVRLWELFSGAHVDVSQVPDWTSSVLWQLALLGFAVALVLLVLIVFTQIRLLQVEHHGFDVRERKEREHHARMAHVARNPKWEAISILAGSDNESDWRRAITEADIMLSSLLAERGYSGDTVGEQLKMANPLQFTTLDLAWEAHKMRNALAHLGEAFPLSERDARATIDLYRRVFEEFDYI